tara:strand:+ start:344 stop:1570 length:1227 start_codon:yes stop_codon:yes gene_type:complete
MKKHILYYTDISFFAGCENMLANFINSEELNNQYNIKLLYRHSKNYEEELYERIINNNTDLITPIKIFNTLKFTYSNNYIYRIIQKIITALPILLTKYLSIAINTLILIKIFKKYKPSILHINNGGYPAASSCYSAVFAAKILRIDKIIYVVNNLAVGYKHPFRWLDCILDYLVSKSVNCFITGSHNAGARLKEVLTLRNSQHKTINNGISKREVTMSREKFFMEHSLNYQGKIVASVIANLEPRKGHIYLLKALKEIKEKKLFNNFIIIIEGQGILKNQLSHYIDINKLDNVIMISRVEKIFDLINASDFLILPSINFEDFPNVIIEAFSLSKPVIGSSIAGIPEQIDHHNNGILVEPKNVNDLIDAILTFKDTSKINEYGKNAKIKFDSKYDVSIAVENYINTYKL